MVMENKESRTKEAGARPGGIVTPTFYNSDLFSMNILGNCSQKQLSHKSCQCCYVRKRGYKEARHNKKRKLMTTEKIRVFEIRQGALGVKVENAR